MIRDDFEVAGGQEGSNPGSLPDSSIFRGMRALVLRAVTYLKVGSRFIRSED